jgi:hypothetical protein
MNATLIKTLVSLDFIIALLQKILLSDEFTKMAQKKPTSFTRNRKMPLVPMVVFMFNLVRQTTNVALNRFFDIWLVKIKSITVQAFSKARKNLRPEAIRFLGDEVIKAIYNGWFNTWHGFRVFAIDGTKLQLPSEPKLRAIFGTSGRNKTAPTAQASTLYDVLNGFFVDALIGPMSFGERAMAMRHLDYLRDNLSKGIKDLALFDRGYASFEMIRQCVQYGITFVTRLKRNFNTAIDSMPLGCHHYFLSRGNERFKIRVIKFLLPDGTIEILITNLFDYNLGPEAFKKLYFKRWPIEVKYGSLKHQLEVENFSSRTEEGIYQDFYVTILLSNIITVGTWEAQVIVDEEDKDKELMYEYKVNFSQAVGNFKDRFIKALLEKAPMIRAKSVGVIIRLMAGAVSAKRPGRSNPRNPTPRVANFHHNQKSNC